MPNNVMPPRFLLPLVAIFALTSCVRKNNSLTVTTIAGTGVMGSANGTGTAASFSNMMGLALDVSGNIYVADSHDNEVRKITPDGAVTTLAGSNKEGDADGKGTAATFFNPAAVAADKSGNIYVADTHNSLIRKISPDGTVTTLAGRATAAEMAKKTYKPMFDNPMGIVTDDTGNVFISDWIHDRICKITPQGTVTTLAGSGEPGSKDGVGAAASFYLPEGLAIDAKGNLYVADCYNNLIRKVTPDGTVTTLAGRLKKGFANGKGSAAAFFHPDGIAVDKKGNVYVADAGNNVIRKVTADGVVSTFAGTGVRGKLDGDVKTAQFYRPMGVAVDTAGNVFVADYQNNLIRRIGF